MSTRVLKSVAGLCFLAAMVMYTIGSNDPKLTELKDFFWAPIPLGIMLAVAAKLRKKD